eukprot:scaffold18162_cov17-Tisochrysis_lutea.AAC.1
MFDNVSGRQCHRTASKQCLGQLVRNAMGHLCHTTVTEQCLRAAFCHRTARTQKQNKSMAQETLARDVQPVIL